MLAQESNSILVVKTPSFVLPLEEGGALALPLSLQRRAGKGGKAKPGWVCNFGLMKNVSI